MKKSSFLFAILMQKSYRFMKISAAM